MRVIPMADGKKPNPTTEKKLTIHAKVYSPFKTYFEEDVYSMSAVNATGPFDVLPMHHNFMTLLNQGDIIVQTERGEGRIRIARGIMHVKDDNVVVFLDV